jgi:hypothetical protein
MFFFLPLMSRGETDNDLVRRFKSGDRDAFGEIVLRYQHRVFTLHGSIMVQVRGRSAEFSPGDFKLL